MKSRSPLLLFLGRLGRTLAGWVPRPAALRSRRRLVCGLTVGITLVCLAARILLIPGSYDELMLLPLLVPVMVSAYLGGFWTGLLSTALGVFGAMYFIVVPQGSMAVLSHLDLLQLVLFFLSGAVGSGLIEALSRAVVRDRRHIERLERVRERLRAMIRGYGELRKALDEHAIVAVTDSRGRITRVNDKFCAISGFAREELIGRDHRLINSGHHPKEFFREMWATIRAGEPWHGEVKNRAKDGSYYWVNTTIVPILSKDDRPSHFIAIRADITARKQAEEALRRQSAELQVLFDLIPAMIWFKDTKNNHLRVNKRAADAVGLPVSEIEGRPAALIYPEEAARFYADDLQVILTRQPKLGIIESIHDQHGNKRWIETNKVPYFDDFGNVIGIVVTAQDITERHAADEALKLSEERFRQLAENIHEVFWIVDPVMRSVLYVSPAYETVCGRSVAELYADPAQWSAAIVEADRQRVRAALADIEHKPYDETYRILRPDGQLRWIHDRGYPVRDATGKVYRLVGTAEDITATRRLQEQFMQSQKMEAIGTLAGGIAHDFNNILGGIIGFTELSKASAKDNRQVQEYLGSVLQASRRAADLVRQILTFSRRQDQRREVVQLRHLVAESLKLMRASIPATVSFDVKLDAKVDPVLADATQVHQALLNLCSNAEHAMRGRAGTLQIRLGNVHIDRKAFEENPRLVPGDYVCLSVADNGSGMPPDVLARVFEPFYTTKPPGEGTGLGLSVVHGVMEAHGGVILAESHSGKGTRFELYFPAQPSSEPAGVTPDTPLPRGQGEHILFVEDEEPLAVFGRVALEQLGYRVTACTVPENALRILRENLADIDLVVTDHTMPGMTGVDLAIQVRKVAPDLPIILATGYSAGIVAARAREAGLDTILYKPLDLRTLGTAVQETLRKKET